MLFCSKSSCCQLTVYVQILLSELGFDGGFLDHLREDYLTPLASLLYPEWVGPSGLDSHRAFTVSYHLEGDTQLSYHFDNAGVTLNVCLGTSFTGGELSFGPMAGVSTGELSFGPMAGVSTGELSFGPMAGVSKRTYWIHGKDEYWRT